MWHDVLVFVAIGFAAQLVDGAIGMAYGITSSSVLLSIGVPPATASACVHAAETFTTGASGFAHWRFENIDRALVYRLAIPGMIGGACGAYALATLDGAKLQPFIQAYLLALGFYILAKAVRHTAHQNVPPRGVVPLGFGGGFLDAIGGGGWGAIVTSTLLCNGVPARFAIGSVSLAEFFVTLVISATFILTIGVTHWPIIAALVAGGIMAAPFAAYATRYVPERVLMVVVASVVIGLSLRGLWRTAAG